MKHHGKEENIEDLLSDHHQDFHIVLRKAGRKVFVKLRASKPLPKPMAGDGEGSKCGR